MAPLPITEDYYMVLEVEQNATPELITKSYKRLAKNLHPDRNPKLDATEAFQLLGQAYETLKNKSKRRAYDLIYPSIRRSSPQNTQTPHPPSASTPQPKALSEAAQIAALQRSRQERGARWRTKKNAFDSLIFELQRDIRRLEQEIKNLSNTLATEAAIEARKNSWGTWLLSSIYKKVEDSEEEKARKDRERQERRIEKDMKERRLELKKADLRKEENLLRKAKEEVNAADLVDNRKIQVIQAGIRAREDRERQERERQERERQEREKQERERRERERQEKEKMERERAAKVWKQQQEQWEKREQEAAEASRKQWAEKRAAEQKRHEERTRTWQKIIDDETKKCREQYTHFDFTEGSARQTCTSTCLHDGWWPKVQGRATCPECYESWTYLLQCPGCKMKACPRCQAAIRPRIARNARTNRRAPP